MPRARGYKKRAPRRRMKKARVAKPLRGLGPFKPYDFKFKLTPNYLRGSISQAGDLTWAPVSGSAGIAPFNAPTIATLPAPSGLTGYYDFGLGAAFRLNDINSVASWTSMYDCYRINKVVCEVEFMANTAASANGQGSLLPTLYMVQDQDSAGPPGNLLTIQGQQGVRRYCVGDKNRIRFGFALKPRVQNLVAAPSTSYQVAKPGMWLNCASPGINHFGLKFYFTDVLLPGVSTTETCIKFNWTYYISFRGPLSNS